MAVNHAWYRSQERAAGLFAVQLLTCQPLALISVNGQNPKSGDNFRIEKWLQHAPLGSPGANPSEWKLSFSRLFRPPSKCFTWFDCLLAEIFFFEYYPPKDAKTKRTFHGISRYFHQFKVPTKVDAGNPGMILSQWPWKPIPRSIVSMLTRTVSRPVWLWP